eukprot:514820_1
MPELDTSAPVYVIPRNNGNQWNIPHKQTLDSFSAPCWYFGQALVDMYNMNTPIGLIDVSVGGTMIEQWTKANTIEHTCKDSLCPNPKCGGLYNGMVSTFVNMTLKSYLWWQGENNCGETPGSWLNDTGYGCMQPFMLKQWRKIWSADVPFGLVSLAGGTDEGHQATMGQFRWAQMANLDYLPNYEMSNTFVALGHDMGEPWGPHCTEKTPPVCTKPGQPYSFAETPGKGTLHPRVKQPIGERLAYAGYNILYGKSSNMVGYPLISGCIMNENTKQIVVTFNSTFLNNQKVKVVPFSAWYNKSLKVEDWSAMQVLIGKNWQYVDGITESTNSNNEVIVDIKSFINNGQTPQGLRYAWNTYPCCGNLNKNYNPCPPDSCPIKTAVPNSNISLPAVPFWAQIVNGKCKCFAPQTC